MFTFHLTGENAMKTTFLVLAGATAFVLAGCGSEAEKPVSYQRDVHPVLAKHCLDCHKHGGAGVEKSGFSVESYQALMKGTKFGPVVVPGSSLSSSLYLMVAGKTDPAIRMPHGKNPLSEAEVDLLRRWMDQGAKEN
jgi:hypothetical protein